MKFLSFLSATPTEQLVELMENSVDVITALFAVVGTVITAIWGLVVANAIFTLPIAIILVALGFRYLGRLIGLLRGMFGAK